MIAGVKIIRRVGWQNVHHEKFLRAQRSAEGALDARSRSGGYFGLIYFVCHGISCFSD
jgi:hypothetical protein